MSVAVADAEDVALEEEDGPHVALVDFAVAYMFGTNFFLFHCNTLPQHLK